MAVEAVGWCGSGAIEGRVTAPPPPPRHQGARNGSTAIQSFYRLAIKWYLLGRHGIRGHPCDLVLGDREVDVLFTDGEADIFVRVGPHHHRAHHHMRRVPHGVAHLSNINHDVGEVRVALFGPQQVHCVERRHERQLRRLVFFLGERPLLLPRLHHQCAVVPREHDLGIGGWVGGELRCMGGSGGWWSVAVRSVSESLIFLTVK